MNREKPYYDNGQMREIRNNADWQKLFTALELVREGTKNKIDDWWARSPLKPDERTPSFHINEKGWYCLSTNVGGGPIELVQKVIEYRTGESLYPAKAAQWLIDNNVSYLTGSSSDNGKAPLPSPALTEQRPKTPKINKPIRQNLITPARLAFDHPIFLERGISQSTREYIKSCYIEYESKSFLANRIAFQIRGVIKQTNNRLQSVILSHFGRATEEKQEKRDGKYKFYPDFHKSIELFNIDNLLLDPEAQKQAKKTGKIILVEGAFDVAKLVEGQNGIKNVVASFGSDLALGQIEKLKFITGRLKANKVLVWYDRDKAGQEGTVKALQRLEEAGIQAESVNWKNAFDVGRVKNPSKVNDACNFSVEELQRLRQARII